MASEKFNSLTGYTVGIPPIDVVDSNGNVVTNVLTPSGNVSANAIYANSFFYANGQPFNPGGVPGGNTYDIQFNDNGNFGGSNVFTFDSSSNTVTLNGSFVTTGNMNLGDISNVTITGGFPGYVIVTDGSGNLSWAAPGGTGTNNLVWTTANNQRILTAYIDPGNITSNVRVANFQNNLLTLTLASFSPTLSATPSPSGSLSWDIPATGFGVTVTNPTDYPDQYISNVANIIATSGTISSLAAFTTTGPTPTPAGGVNWTQSFTTNGSSYIYPISSTIAGGSAAGTIGFNYWNGVSEVAYTVSSATITINWATPTLTVALSSLTGQTFLGSYASTTYTVTVTGMNNPSNYVNTVTSVGGSVSNPVGSGTFTFTTAINKDNTGTTRTVSSSTTFTRPVTVTGSSYSAILSSTGSIASIGFTYPSLWVWTASPFNVPTRSNFVSGNSFAIGVTVLGNQVKTFGAYINNTQLVPQTFWFAIRQAASQPTTFKTGPSPSLLSDVAVTTGNTVGLEPDSPPLGYVTETYDLYGIILQPGTTYVSIA